MWSRHSRQMRITRAFEAIGEMCFAGRLDASALA
jgi:hypothetical protein